MCIAGKSSNGLSNHCNRSDQPAPQLIRTTDAAQIDSDDTSTLFTQVHIARQTCRAGGALAPLATA